MSDFKLNLFADDSYLSLSDQCPIALEARTNDELQKVHSWLNYNKLSINIKKTFYMITTPKKLNHKPVINIGDSQLAQCSNTTYLGVEIDDKMSWTPHIEKVKKKLTSATWAMTRLTTLIDERAMTTLYYGLVHSKLAYCISCWGGCSEKKRKKLVTLQKRAIRTISKVSKMTHASPFFKKLKVLKLDDMYRHQIAVIMHKEVDGKWTGDFNFNRSCAVHSHQTRFALQKNFTFPATSCEAFKQSISFIGPLIWKEVPNCLKNLPLKSFKNTYKDYLINNY